MKKERRFVAALLVLSLIYSLLPASVFAADVEEDGVMPLTTVDDHTPPVVTGVYMNSPGGTVTVGDTLYFTVSAEDESGFSMIVSWLSFTFVCEQKHEHTISAYGYQDSYNVNQGLKRGRKTAQKSRECKYVANKSHKALLRCLRQ